MIADSVPRATQVPRVDQGAAVANEKWTPMDISGKTAQLCILGTQAEFERRLDDARALFSQAWDNAVDDYDRAIAAHYIAHLEPNDGVANRWDQVALEHAGRDGRAAEFVGSLLVSLGGSFERLGEKEKAGYYFAEAARHGVTHFRG
jgi:hypothetical protein